MQRFFLFATCFTLFILLAACGGETPENAFPKTLPVDNRAKKEQAKALANKNVVTAKAWDKERQQIEERLKHNSSYYQTSDGIDGMTREYTSYYLDEEKTIPVKTSYTYSTGSFDLVYWLPNGQIWLVRDGYDFFVENGRVLLVLHDGEAAQATANERKEALEVVTKAKAQVNPSNYNF